MLDWHRYLIERRKVLLSQIDWLSSGRMQVYHNREDVSKAALADERANLAEIEEILTAAGISFD